ncbi:MAG: hypothetical protein J7K68_03950 [Candidatus Diapherotrites archaeon]|nr:hypothetical protein [Candidatus Diapherotrites archaeon]
MPEGVPRTDEERRERHKEKYGTEEIPEERKGKASKALEQKKNLILAIKVVLVLAILYFLWIIVKRGWVT